MRHPQIDSRRHIIHTTTTELLPAWQTAASRHRPNAPPARKSRKTIRALVRYLNLENWTRHCRAAPCLGSAPAKLNLSSRRRPSFGPPFSPFPVLLGWEWVQTECEVIAKMPLLVPIKHSQPRSQHGSCFCSPSASAVVWAMPTTHRGVSQCSATTAPLRDLVPAW